MAGAALATAPRQKFDFKFKERVLPYAEESSQEKAARDITAMDKTAAWFEMVSPSTIDTQDAKSVALKTTGHEQSHLTIVLPRQTAANSSLLLSSERMFVK